MVAFATLLIAGTGIVAGSTAAQAATKTATFTNQVITTGTSGNGTVVDENSTINVGASLRFDTDWAISGQVLAGDTFEVPLPSNVGIVSSAPFNLTKGTQTLATCVYDMAATPGKIVCTFAPGGPYASPSGDLFFVGRLQAPPEGEPPPEWEVGGQVLPMPVPKPVEPGTPTLPFGTMKRGSGSIVEGKAVMSWQVFMWPGDVPNTPTFVTEFNISDSLTTTAPNAPHKLVPGTFKLERWQKDMTPGAVPGAFIPGTRSTLPFETTSPAGEVVGKVNIDASLTSYTLNISELVYGYEYYLSYQTEADGVVSFTSDVFHNVANVNGTGLPAEASPVAYGGGGADAGDYTQFQISKTLTNNTSAAMPENFVLVASTAGEADVEISIPANGDAVLSPYFLAANPVKLCETVPVVAGVTWAPYTITGTGVTGPDAAGCYTITGAGGANIELSVNNTANSSTGTFSVTKSVTGPADVVAMTDGTSYTVNGVAATTPLTVTVGQPVTSPALPVGATVVLTEVKPVVTGVVFGTPVFTPSTVTIGQGTNVAVTLENPVTLATGGFSVTKDVTGPDAAVKLAAGTTYTVDYTVDGVKAATPITLKDGETKTVEGLPFGSKVVLSEAAPVTTGVIYGTPKFSATDVTIGDKTVVAVTLENPATLKPVTSPPAKLPNTGAEALGLAAGAAALIAAGAAAVLIRRRRTQD